MPLLPLLILAASAAQAPAPAAPESAPPAPAFARRGGRPFISPMGEPFRPTSRDGNGLAEWFAQADRNHDGQLTLDEMQADADRFFALLDGNHDGEIDPDEIEHYETVIAPEISSGDHFAMAAMDTAEPETGGDRAGYGGRGGGHHHGGGGASFHRPDSDGHQGAARFGLLDLPEPVTAADTNFNRGVSREEFRQAAAQRFLALDLDHRGLLTLAGLDKIRPAPPAQPNRQVIPGQPPSDSSAPTMPDNY
jgi:Ca2+-binding EF-hand superfamily protein